MTLLEVVHLFAGSVICCICLVAIIWCVYAGLYIVGDIYEKVKEIWWKITK